MNLNNENILFHKINKNGENFSFLEIFPPFSESNPENILSIDSSGNLSWNKFPSIPEPQKIPEIPSFDVIVDDKIKSTNIFYKDGRIGISRPPLHSYKFDIAVPTNTLMTAFHVGDGSFGFSMGNGTTQGFIPEIIGMGSDENDAGLYLLGRSGNDLASNIPLIIIDGRNSQNKSLKNRPILGITSGDYSKYKFIIDQDGRVGLGKIPEIYSLEINGSLQADDVIIEGLSIRALIDVIQEHQNEIDKLKDKIELLLQQK
jgi:hypothetical protein